jgi:hypothetical protein
VARNIGSLPAGADAGADAFALVNVHAWSFRESGGPMGAIGRTVAGLPPGVRVVTASEFFELMAAEAPSRDGKKGD